MAHTLRFSAIAAFVALLACPLRAEADPAQLPPSQPPPSSVPTANGEFVAPLQQATQPSYVPQSVAISGPRVIKDYTEGDPVPPGYHPDTRVRKGLVIGGSVLFGTTYLLSALVGAAVNDTGGRGTFLMLPVVGPFLQMAVTDSSTGNVVLAIDGLAQGAGALMFILGITSPRTVLVRNDLAEVRLTPMKVGERGSGLGLLGTF